MQFNKSIQTPNIAISSSTTGQQIKIEECEELVGPMGSVVENPEYLDVDCPTDCNRIELAKVMKPKGHNALVILNQEIKVLGFKKIWKKFEMKVCGDGGANRLFDFLETESERLRFIPDFITGDLDSLRPDVRQWYESRGTVVLQQKTQYATDLDKCLDLVEVVYSYRDTIKELDLENIDNYDGLIELHKTLENRNRIQVLLVGGIGGRFDHTVQSIALLFRIKTSNPFLDLIYISSTDLILLISKGAHYLGYEGLESVIHGANTGLLPIGGEVLLSTKGFKWDVEDWPSSMKSSVSSSNRLVGSHGALIRCSDDFVVNIELNHSKLSEWYS